MKSKSFIPIRVSPLGIYTFLILSVTILQSCHNNAEKQSMAANSILNADTSTLTYWVNMEIRFKPGTTDEVMDMAVKNIKYLLIDSVNKMRQGKYPDFAPGMAIKSNRWVSPLNVSIQMNYSLVDSTVNPPPCKNPCTTHCGVCAMIAKLIVPTSGDPLSNSGIEYISFEGEMIKP